MRHANTDKRSGGHRSLHLIGRGLLCVVLLAGSPALFAGSVAADPAKNGADALSNVQGPSGLFRYDFDFLSSKTSDKDNIVRQAGAGYGLAEYFLDSKDERTGKTIAAALRAYSTLSLPWQGGRLVATRDGDINGARTGATALALLTELQYQEASGDQQFRHSRKSWVSGLLSLYRANGGFSRSPESESESDFYNGEAWLALAYYNMLFPDDQDVSAVLEPLDSYLIQKYSLNPTTSFFHWGAMASAVRFKSTGTPRFREFASRQTEHYLERLRPTFHPNRNTCYALEGLIAVAEILDSTADRHFVAALNQRIERENAKNREFQIKPGQDRIDFGGDRYLYSKDLASYSGAFLRGRHRPQTRIDTTQHCISAMVKYTRYSSSRAENDRVTQ